MRAIFISVMVLMFLSGCLKGVRQEDLDAWVGQPVSMLDTHPFFLTVPLEKRFTADGVEVRIYRNGRSVSRCSSQSALVNSYSTSINSYANCYQDDVVCNNIFFIKNNRVIRYSPTGRCYTDATVRPKRML